jgi:hypothetical protein
MRFTKKKFAQDTRILLASSAFSKELTTTVIWLREHDIDIRCVRMKPFKMADGTVLLDVQQIIPLPEATAFQTQIGVKKQAERQSLNDRHFDRMKFWQKLLDYAKTLSTIHANRKPTKDHWISGSIGRRDFSLNYVVRESDSQVELWISGGGAKAAYRALEAQKDAIEADFGGQLDWQELPEREGCRIRCLLEGGYRSPQEQWQTIISSLVNAMVRIDKAMRARVANL